MAKPIKGIELPSEDASPVQDEPKLTPIQRKMAKILLDLASEYRAAGIALRAGRDKEVDSAMETVGVYQALFNKLAQRQSDAVTAEGLAQIAEM